MVTAGTGPRAEAVDEWLTERAMEVPLPLAMPLGGCPFARLCGGRARVALPGDAERPVPEGMASGEDVARKREGGAVLVGEGGKRSGRSVVDALVLIYLDQRLPALTA